MLVSTENWVLFVFAPYREAIIYSDAEAISVVVILSLKNICIFSIEFDKFPFTNTKKMQT